MNEIEFTLTKVRDYKLKPFGRFNIKFKASEKQARTVGIIPFGELRFDYNTGMPLPDNSDTDKAIVKFMIKNKTDILVNDSTDYFTRCGVGLTLVSHPKLQRYNTFLRENGGVDDLEMWEAWQKENNEI